MPTDHEENSLQKIGSAPIEKPRRSALYRRKLTPGELRKIVHLRTKQTFIYHTCDVVAQGGWAVVQNELNEAQRALEELYDTSSVECVNVYRKNNTKDNGISIIMIFKIGPIEKLVEGDPPERRRPVRAWWTRKFWKLLSE